MLPGKPIALPEILRILRRRAWLLIVPPAITLFAALLYSSTIPNLYQADMLIAIDAQRVPDAFVRPTVTMPIEQQLESIKVQVLSRTALQETIESFDLYRQERQTLPMEDVINKMRSDIEVNLERPVQQRGMPPSPGAFHIRFVHTDPQVAARVTQQIGSLFVAQNTLNRGRLAGATNRFLEEQLADARKKLETQEAKLERFRELHGKELPTQMQGNMQSLTSAQTQAQSLNESVARDRDRKMMLDRIYREAVNEPPPAVPVAAAAANAAPAVSASAEDQLTAARGQLEGLLLRYKPDHPDVVRLRRLITELEPKAAAEARLKAERAAAPNAADQPATAADPAQRESLRQMRADIESLDRQIAFKEAEERRVRGEIVEYQRRLEAVPGLESEWVRLTRDYETQQIAYRDLLTKSTSAQVAANLEDAEIGERFRIVDPAAVPVHPLPSQRIRYNAMGLAFGLLLGLAIAALLELKDQSFRSEGDVLEALGLPVLATVPRVHSVAEKRRAARRSFGFTVAGVAYVVVAGYVAWTLKLWNSVL
jgi:polysaccharide chain length determinant protein (PEP-CTERM system associated)